MRLKELRISKNWSMEYLGKLVGVSDQTISNWERGRNQPSIKHLIKLADIFEVTVDYLVERDRTDGLINVLMNSSLSDSDELRALIEEYLNNLYK